MLKRILLFVYICLVLIMGIATFLEHSQGTPWVTRYIYHSPIFLSVWALLAVLTLAVLHRLRMWRKTFVWMLHLSFIIILVGAGISFLTSRKGQLHLRMNVPAFRFMEQETQVMKELPFILRLDTFWVESHSDTGAPSDYVSRVSCLTKKGEEDFSATVSMNRILKHQGYRFYQSSYDEDGRGSWLMVNYDPWGTPVTYMGYLLFALSMLGVMLGSGRMYRKLLHHPSWSQGMNQGWLEHRSSKFQQVLQALLLLVLLFHGGAWLHRWYVGGRIPLGNVYETMQFLSLCVLALAWVFRRRFPLVVLGGLLLAGCWQLVPCMMGLDSQILPLAPVLMSSWLCVHVSFIMVAYAFLCFISLHALLALCIPKQADRLKVFCRVLLYPALFFLGTGIFLGAMWANVSWGRYWAWDPKEVWALITFMLYGVAFHSDSFSWLNRPRIFHAYLLCSFLAVLMTYFGVNFLLGGMHSYM